jgi:single-strand DNA-binding protein
MANLNKVMLIGRLTRDPEVRTFSTGGKVAAFGFAVNNRKKNQQTGQWEDEPVFLDVEAFNRREGGRQLADLVEQHMHKGHQFYLEGHLRLDQWTDKDGQKRSKLKIVLDDFQFLEPRQDGGGQGGDGASRAPRMASSQAPRRATSPSPAVDHYDEPEPEPMEPTKGPGDEEIPF